MKKAGPSYDLPIAVGILICSGQITADVTKTAFLGELSLDGSLRHTHGILPMVALAAENGLHSVFVPAIDAREASLVQEAKILPANSLSEFTKHLNNDVCISYYEPDVELENTSFISEIDLADIKGQEHVKRGLKWPQPEDTIF